MQNKNKKSLKLFFILIVIVPTIFLVLFWGSNANKHLRNENVLHTENVTLNRIDISTIIGPTSTFNCPDTTLSEDDAKSFIGSIVDPQYSDIVNYVHVDTISSGTCEFSCDSRKYFGNASFEYTLFNKISLASIFSVSGTGQVASINSTFDYTITQCNTFSKFLNCLKVKYPTVNINQLQLVGSYSTVKNNDTNMYTVKISPVANSYYYLEDATFNVSLQFDGRTFNNFTLGNGNFNCQYNKTYSSTVSISNQPTTGVTYSWSITTSYSFITINSTSGQVSCASGNGLTYGNGSNLNYTAICTISKSGYTSKQISTTFTVSIVKNTDTNWASISSINQSNSNLINKNFSIGRIASTSCTLSATWSGFSTNTTISYELASNPNSVMSLSGTTLSINTACATKGLKTYAIKATLSNPNYTNVISLTSTWQVRLGAKLSLNLSSDQGGYWNAAAVNYYSGYDAYKAFDSNTTGTSHCFQFENPSGYLWVGFYPDAVQDLYITGFEFIGYQGGNYYGPSGIRLDATRNASTSGTGQTTIYNTTTSGLPTSQTTWYGALNTWGLNYCTMWFYITRLNNWLGLANFQVYEG